MARTGLCAAKALLDSGANVLAYDDDAVVLHQAKAQCPALVVAELTIIDWQQVNYLLLSPGIPLYGSGLHKAVEMANHYGVEIISDLDILYLACPNATYIGITGTNGKSTTAALMAHVLREVKRNVQLGGNIGLPVLQLQPQEDGFFVLELSSYQLDLIRYLYLDFSIITNITIDHIDRHGTIERYVEAKSKILERLQPQGTAILSIDYPYTKNLVSSSSKTAHVSQVNSSADVFIKDRMLHDNINKTIYDFTDYLHLPGSHNEENIATVYATLLACGVESEQIVPAIKTFKGLEHRIQTVFKTNYLTFINDSKATNADAAEKALCCYKNIYWIAGGLAKEGGITSLLPLIQTNVVLTLLIGTAQLAFAQTLNELNLPYVLAGTLEKALNYLNNIPNAKGVVLFSPACASMDQFKNYEHRGEEFRRLVIEKFSDK